MKNGVSIIICCYNSAKRLPETLQRLKQQNLSFTIPWEVIVVDNASLDQTSLVATRIWGDFSGAPLRVVQESQLGKTNAILRGFQEATNEFVCLVDDDNWVADNWVETVYQLMMDHPSVAVCGGMSEAVFEAEPPKWLINFHSRIAVGEQYASEGDITETRGWLWGAGQTIRKTAWEEILKKEEPFLLPDRIGGKLNGGGDNEICYILRLLGWRLYYSPHLKLKHYIPSSRLPWDYFCKIAVDNGYANVVVKRYIRYFQNRDIQNPLKYLWSWVKLVIYYIKTWALTKLESEKINFPGSMDYFRYLSLSEQLKTLLKLGPHGLRKIDKKISRWQTL